MRARNIKPGIFKNEILGQADPIYTLLFIGLWGLADKEGILEDRPLRIKAELFPYRDIKDINGELTQLARWGFIQRYQIDGQNFIHIINFQRHQSPHHTEKRSGYPTPSKGIIIGCDLTVGSRLENGGYPPDSLIPDSLIPDSLIPDSLIPDSGRRDSCAKPDKPAHAPPSPVVFQVPCSGTGPKIWDMTQAKMDEWKEAFPGVDVLLECKKAIQWLRDNPVKAKTHKGMAAYFGRWLSKAQDYTHKPGAPNGNTQKHRFSNRDAEVTKQWVEAEAKRTSLLPVPDPNRDSPGW